MLLDVRPILHEPGKHHGTSAFSWICRCGAGRPVSHLPPCGGGGNGAQHRRCTGAGADGPQHPGRRVRPVRQGLRPGQGDTPSGACWRRSSRTRTTTRSSCWKTDRRMWRIWPGRPSSSEWTQKTLCSEDCKGLCPRCGADLNLGPCSCKKETDTPAGGPGQALENK